MSRGISFSGLSSGIDSAQIVEQLMAIERRPITLLENQQAREQNKLTVLQEINTRLLSVKTSVEALSKGSDFDQFNVSSSNESLVGVSASGTAKPGSFSVEVLSLARAQTRSSQSFSSDTEELGLSGDILINGQAISVSSGHSLKDIQEAIADANAGVSAQILKVSNTDYRLLITSQATGAAGFSLLDASSGNVLQSLGFTGTATSIKNAVSGGAQTDAFASATSAVGNLRGLNNALSGSVTIGDQVVNIDLSSQSLQDIKAAIDAAAPTGVTTSVVSETDDSGTTVFRLQIDGTTVFSDQNNVLEALGVLQGSSEVDPAVARVLTSNVGNTTDGSTAMDADTRFGDIFGAGVSNGDTISISGTDRDGNAVSGSFEITNINSTRVQELLDEIRSVFGDAATATMDDSGRIVITDDVSGESVLSVNLSANNEGGGTLNLGAMGVTVAGANAISREVVSGQDASFRINGVTLTRSGNVVTDAVNGISLNLKSAQPGSLANVDIAQDTSVIRQRIETLVSSYNDAMKLISDQFVFNESTQTSGALSGDATLLTLQSQLRSVLTTPVAGLPDSQNALTLFGVSFNRQGLLEIDGAKLNAALTGNLTALRRVLTANGETSDANVEFVFQSDNTKAGTYDVFITTAPERASATGTTDLTGGLAAAESLTIVDMGTSRSETIELSAGETIDDIVSKINSTLGSSVAQVRTGSVANTTDGDAAIAGATTFDSLFGAGVVAGDTIDIQGTLRSGARVSGTFTISDPATQTVNDFLAEIRSVFGGDVSTSISANGEIVVADNQVGNTQMTLALIERNEGGGSLDFGTMSVTKEGRFAIGVTAENDAGKLKLTTDAYGSKAGFTISQSTGEMGLTDDTYQGVDVTGTINGETATGDGRVLIGSYDSDSVSGLSVRVNLTPEQLALQGGNQGTVKITQGVADQLRRTLKSVTDPFEGLVTARKSAIEKTIEVAQNQITALDARLLLKQDTLSRQFTAMEKAVAEFNSLGSFLGSQLASLPAASSR